MSTYARSVLRFALFAFALAAGAARSAEWQWSAPDGEARAYLWIPPDCGKVRGFVLANRNMLEESVLEHPVFRATLAELGAGHAQVVVRYSLSVPYDAPAKDPRDWILEGSDDGSNWVVLDSRTNQAFAARAMPEDFAVEAAKLCRYHRIRLTACQGGAGQAVHLSELRLLARPLADEPRR